MGKSRIDTSFYENNDFSTELKESGVIKYSKAGTKRITSKEPPHIHVAAADGECKL